MPKTLNHEEIGKWNRTITRKEIESVNKYFPIKKSPEQNDCIGAFYQHLLQNT